MVNSQKDSLSLYLLTGGRGRERDVQIVNQSRQIGDVGSRLAVEIGRGITAEWVKGDKEKIYQP
jgi:hypothetical protein